MEKSNSEIAAFLERTAVLMEIKGDNPFKVRSYRVASDVVSEVDVSVAEIARERGAAGLQELPGVGKSIGGQIAEFVETGTSDHFERLRAEIPETVADVLLVRGIGIKMATTLHNEFGVLGLDDLALFAEGGGFEAVPGLGDKQIARLVSSVAAAWAGRPRVPLSRARAAAERLAAGLRERLGGEGGDGAAARESGVRAARGGGAARGQDAACGARAARGEGAARGGDAARLTEIVVAGEVRRGVPEVTSIDLVAVVDGDRAAATAAFASLPDAAKTTVLASSRAEVVTRDGLPARLAVVSPDERGLALVRATGPLRHARELEERAAERGVSLEGAETEEEVYARLGLAYVPPEKRAEA